MAQKLLKLFQKKSKTDSAGTYNAYSSNYRRYEPGTESRDLVQKEFEAQKAVAESPDWLMARLTDDFRGEDTRLMLEDYGFTDIKVHDDLFYSTTPPKGWRKESKDFHTFFYNGKNETILYQYFKGAIYDRSAWLKEYGRH